MTKKTTTPQKTKKKSAKTTSKKTAKKVQKSAKTAPKTRKKAQRIPSGSRSDGVQAAVDVVQAVFDDITPPDHVKLKKVEMVFWDSIINEFAKIEWSDHTLELAAMLARNMYAYEKAQRKLAKEGEVLERKAIKKAPKDSGQEDEVVVTGYFANPIKSFIKMYHENILSLRRSLSLQARVKNGEPRDVAKKRDAAKATEQSINDLDDKMSLIARPTTVQ